MAIMTIRSLRRDHSSMTIFFFFCLGGLVVSSLWSIRGDWRMPTAFESGMIVLMGLLSAGGQVLFTYALKFARALESSVFSQIVVVWVYIGQIVLWDEELTWMTAAGAVIIFLACIYLGAAGPQAEETPD
jgi:drug/metabolite transporter (DMT)-like permease